MDARIKELLKPEILHTVDGLELVARVVTEGFMSGSNRSFTVGTGQEFSQYKTYQAGDDLRQLDWKMFARSGRYYVKQAEIETNITIKFILDASRSMSYAEEGMSKLQYARLITASMAYLARKQSDTFGLYGVNGKGCAVVQPRHEQQQFMRFLHALVNLEGDGMWSNATAAPLLDHHGKEMIVFITDLYDTHEDLPDFISQLKTRRNEVMVFHLMGKTETDLGWDGSLTFEELESGVRTKANTALERKAYGERLQRWLQQCKNLMLEQQVNYRLVMLNEPVDSMLYDFLTLRKRLLK